MAGMLTVALMLGNYYRLGRGDAKDLIKARQYLKQSCDGGDEWDCGKLKLLDE